MPTTEPNDEEVQYQIAPVPVFSDKKSQGSVSESISGSTASLVDAYKMGSEPNDEIDAILNSLSWGDGQRDDGSWYRGIVNKSEAREAIQRLIVEAEAKGYKKGRSSVSIQYRHEDYDLKMQAALNNKQEGQQ